MSLGLLFELIVGKYKQIVPREIITLRAFKPFGVREHSVLLQLSAAYLEFYDRTIFSVELKSADFSIQFVQ